MASLHSAAYGGHIDIIFYFVAKLSRKEKSGGTPPVVGGQLELAVILQQKAMIIFSA